MTTNVKEFIDEVSAMSKLADRYNIVTFLTCIPVDRIQKLTLMVDDPNATADRDAYAVPYDKELLGKAVDTYNEKLNVRIPISDELKEQLIDKFVNLFYGTASDGKFLVFLPTKIDMELIDSYIYFKMDEFVIENT